MLTHWSYVFLALTHQCGCVGLVYVFYYVCCGHLPNVGRLATVWPAATLWHPATRQSHFIGEIDTSHQQGPHSTTGWYGNAWQSTGPLWRESTGHRWIPLTRSQECRPVMFLLLLLLAWRSHWANSWVAHVLIHINAYVMSLNTIDW